MEENKPLRRSTRILKKIEQQAVGTSTVDELSIAVTQNLVQIKEALDEKILDLQKLFDEKLSVIRGAFDATVVDIHPEPRFLDNTSRKTAQFPNASPIVTSLETTTTSFTDATFTGTTASTILPSNPSTKLYSISNNNNNSNNNNHDNNNESQPVIYEEESCNFDETFLSTEDYDFIDTIQSPTFSGISLPSLFYDSSKYSSLPIPTLSDVYNSVTVSSGLTINNQESLSRQPILGVNEVLLVNKYNFDRRLSVYINYQYRIFFWDPGKKFSYVHHWLDS